ncbi:hypothetical protein Rs2_28821 [Raphanus sativus]|nr:Uncharacterized protein Rs2_28743 [Raphanus sativus]KAJ4889073.1 hypothetical protein Rs2_28821 [Raphanus sativus]
MLCPSRLTRTVKANRKPKLKNSFDETESRLLPPTTVPYLIEKPEEEDPPQRLKHPTIGVHSSVNPYSRIAHISGGERKVVAAAKRRLHFNIFENGNQTGAK